MKITKLIKLGVQAGIVWSIAWSTKELVDNIVAIPFGKATEKLEDLVLRDLAKKVKDKHNKIKSMEEILNARKKEESAEDVSEDFLQ